MNVQKLFLSCPLGKGSYGILSSKDKTLLKRPLLCLPVEISDHSGEGVQGHARLALINGSVVVCSCLLVFALGDGLPKQQLFSLEQLPRELSPWWGPVLNASAQTWPTGLSQSVLGISFMATKPELAGAEGTGERRQRIFVPAGTFPFSILGVFSLAAQDSK